MAIDLRTSPVLDDLVSAWLAAFAQPSPAELPEPEVLRALKAQLPERARCAGVLWEGLDLGEEGMNMGENLAEA